MESMRAVGYMNEERFREEKGLERESPCHN